MLTNLDVDIWIRLAYAVGVGALIGLERSVGQALERTRGEPPKAEEPGSGETPREDLGELLGVRTFTLLSLIGFGAGLASEKLPLVAPVVLAGASALIIAMYRRAPGSGAGITTEAAAIGACALGVLCVYQPQIAGVTALVVTILLASKRVTHSAVRRMRRVELTDTLKFLVAVFIILPLLPDRTLDPYGAFNPFKVGLLVVLISGIGFVGYFLSRFLGARRGLGLTGILGGISSSTAVTASMATQARQAPQLSSVCAVATLAANATMFVRVLVVVALVDWALMGKLLWPLGTMAVVTAAACAMLWIRSARASGTDCPPGSLSLKNPFSLGPAIRFAFFFVAILFAARLARMAMGDQGLYLAGALSGLADVDAISLSVSEQTASAEVARGIGAMAIAIAVVTNGLVKSGIAIATGGWRHGRTVLMVLSVATLAGLGVGFFLAP